MTGRWPSSPASISSPTPRQLDQTFARFQANFEQLDGHLLEIGRELRRPSDLDVGPLLEVDPLFAAYDPGAHVTEDLFQQQAGVRRAAELPADHAGREAGAGQGLQPPASGPRCGWPGASAGACRPRCSSRSPRRRPPPSCTSPSTTSGCTTCWTRTAQRLFPKGLRLISPLEPARRAEGQLRRPARAGQAADDRPGDGADRHPDHPAGGDRQPARRLEPVHQPGHAGARRERSRTTRPRAATARRPLASRRRSRTSATRKLRANFQAARRADPYSPVAPTQIARAFELGAEMPEARVKALLTEVLTSPLVAKVAALAEQRLGRTAGAAGPVVQRLRRPGQDPRGRAGRQDPGPLPTREAFAKDIPRILRDLGFSAERARYLAARIVVDPVARRRPRAAGGPARATSPTCARGSRRTGMNYKGYNIAVHELGHNVEQVFSLYDVDHTLLAGVPNTAFTEALAFVFQAKDLRAARATPSPTPRASGCACSTTSGRPGRSPAWPWWTSPSGTGCTNTRSATPQAAARGHHGHRPRGLEPVLRAGAGRARTRLLLGIYSHMINYPLYLFNYPLGHLIAFQIEEHVKKTRQAWARSSSAWPESGRGQPRSVDGARHRRAGERRAAAARHRGGVASVKVLPSFWAASSARHVGHHTYANRTW